jgi:hypothetical protein
LKSIREHDPLPQPEDIQIKPSCDKVMNRVVNETTPVARLDEEVIKASLSINVLASPLLTHETRKFTDFIFNGF